MKERNRWWIGGIVVGIVVSFWVRWPLVFYNLPVAAHVDERLGLGMLVRFANGNWDPNFFEYPTFYYYVTHFVSLPFARVADVLLTGRLLNLLLAGGLAVAIFLVGRDYMGSTPAGVIAALFSLFSPILILDTSYVSTDIAMSLLVLLAFWFIYRFYQTGHYRWWFMAMVCGGLAVSTKYNAAFIVIVLVVMAFVWQPAVKEQTKISRWLEAKLPSKGLLAIVLVGGLVALIIYLAIPDTFFERILQSGAGANSVVDSSDLAFIQRLRTLLLMGGIGLLAGAVVLYRFPQIAERVALVRPYVGVVLMVGVFFVGSPFAVPRWQLFAYDLGYQLKANQSGTSAFWEQYTQWYRFWESEWVLALAVVGMGWYVWGWWRGVSRPGTYPIFLLFYALLNYLSIGSATRGYVRYLTPILPILFIFAGYGLVQIAKLLNEKQPSWWLGWGFMGVMLVLVGVEVVPRMDEFISGRVATTDEMYHSYRFILDEQANNIAFAGYAPDVELANQDVTVQEQPRTLFATSPSALPRALATANYLIVDSDVNRTINLDNQPRLRLVWSNDQGFGQYIYEVLPEPSE